MEKKYKELSVLRIAIIGKVVWMMELRDEV